MRHFYFLSALLLISTCGGGGGGGGSAPVAPTPNISVTLSASADSAEVNSSITLTWSSTLATSCSASGSWSGSKGTSGSESITIGVVGSNTFSLSCLATGANSGSASTTVNGLRYFDGKVFDGYIRGAEVFVDTNDNLTLDANEASVSTDNAGSFSKLLFGNGILVAKGGIDLDTGADLSKLTLVHKLDGYETSKLASPFTTMIAYMSDASTINAALGIDASIDLLTTDPIPNLGDGIYDQMYEKGNQLTVLSYTLQNHSDAVDGTSELYFQAIADQLEESYAANQAAVDIEDSTFISKVIDKVETAKDVTFSSDVKANLNTVLSSTIPLLKVYADASTTASVQRFAFSTLQNDVKDSTVMIGNASATLLKYENNVFEYVASDQGIDEAAINPINNIAPTISSAATFSAAENQTSIGSVTATDADGDTLTYSISGSEINISSSGVLTFASAPDRETKDSYTATVTVSDGTNSTTQNITVNISDINEPPVLSLNINQTTLPNLTFAENECTQCAGFTVTDPEGSSSIRLSISGTDAGVMNTDRLNNFSGAIYFPQGFDMEDPQDSDKDNIYNYTFTATEYGNGCGGMLDNADVGTCLSTSQELNVIITNVSEHTPSIRCSPCDFNSGISVAENQTAVANVAGYDRDWGSDLVYSLSGTDAASFNITNASPSFATLATSPVTMNSSDTCYIAYGWDTSQFTCQYGTITFKSAPDYETKSSYSININVTADGDTFTWENVTINVTDVEE